MTDVWKKLNLKNHPQVVVIDAPQSFEDEIDRLESTQVVRSCGNTKRWKLVQDLVTESYRLIAPKRSLKKLDA